MRLDHSRPYLIELVAQDAPLSTSVVYSQVDDPYAETRFATNQITIKYGGEVAQTIRDVFAKSLTQILHVARALAGDYQYVFYIRKGAFRVGPSPDVLIIQDGRVEITPRGVTVCAQRVRRVVRS